MSHPESKAAAKWWADHLRQETPVQLDNGDVVSEVILTVQQSMQRRPSPEQVDRFEDALTALVEAKIIGEWAGHWEKAKSDPLIGSGLRIISTDYGPDCLLRDALKEAGISTSTLLLPIKSWVGINPGLLEAAQGYGAPIVEIPIGGE